MKELLPYLLVIWLWLFFALVLSAAWGIVGAGTWVFSTFIYLVFFREQNNKEGMQ